MIDLYNCDIFYQPYDYHDEPDEDKKINNIVNIDEEYRTIGLDTYMMIDYIENNYLRRIIDKRTNFRIVPKKEKK